MRVQLRSVPGTPIVHLNRSVVVLEPPSDVTLHTKRQVSPHPKTPLVNSKSRYVQAEEKALLPSAPESRQVTTEEVPKRKRKGPKGPNPLSVKKKRASTNDSQATAGTKRKREEGRMSQSDGVEHEGKPKRKRRKKAALAHTKDPD